MRVAIKVIGTALVTVLLTYPLWAPQWGQGILGEFWAAGMPGGLIAVLVFFGLVALYCRGLQRTLMLTGHANPASVWWMFAIPYNFTEDFFIVRNVSVSLAGRMSDGFVRRWTVVGYAWCAFQILSLFPGIAGYVGGAIAIPLWIGHWAMTSFANNRLAVADRAVAAV